MSRTLYDRNRIVATQYISAGPPTGDRRRVEVWAGDSMVLDLSYADFLDFLERTTRHLKEGTEDDGE